MLKLDQIELVSDDIIVEVLEPIVYTHVGSIAKTEEKLTREKAEAPHRFVKVIKLGKEVAPDNKEGLVSDIKVGQLLLVGAHAVTPYTFPIEGYSEPKLGELSRYAIKAIITVDESPVLMKEVL